MLTILTSATTESYPDQVENTMMEPTFDGTENFKTLHDMLGEALQKCNTHLDPGNLDEITDQTAQPNIWISKWVDYSDKYGFGYQLSDEEVGVMFNDTTKLILMPNGVDVHFIGENGEQSCMRMDSYPGIYMDKMKLLAHFCRYMYEHLSKTGTYIAEGSDSLPRPPILHQWCRSTAGVLMQLNNGTVQMNFFDHTKIIMDPVTAAITFIDTDNSFRTFRFERIEKDGCPAALYEKMRLAHKNIELLLEN